MCTSPKSLHLFFSAKKPVYRQRQIPQCHCQFPYQNHAADQPSENNVQRKNANRPGNTHSNRDERKHLADAKRHTASQSDQKIVSFSILRKYPAENRKKYQCKDNRQNRLFQKILHYIRFCHSHLRSSFTTLHAGKIVFQFSLHDLYIGFKINACLNRINFIERISCSFDFIH